MWTYVKQGVPAKLVDSLNNKPTLTDPAEAAQFQAVKPLVIAQLLATMLPAEDNAVEVRIRGTAVPYSFSFTITPVNIAF